MTEGESILRQTRLLTARIAECADYMERR